jgi:hypothetical protein
MANIFMMNEEIAHGMVCFFHQKKHFYLIICFVNLKGVILQHFAFGPPVHYILLIELYICINIGLKLR